MYLLDLLKQFSYQKYIGYQKKIKFGKNVKINGNSSFEGRNAIYNNSEFRDSSIGYASYIASNSIIRNTKIGRFCAIGDNVRTYLGIHPSKDFVSIHPAFFSTMRQAGFTFTQEQLFDEHKYIDSEKRIAVEIGNDVWIGNNVMIMDGVKLGDGAIVAGGAVVTKDVEPYSIVAGIPAKLIKYRFSQDQITKLLKIQWWNWDVDKLNTCSNNFVHVDDFICKHG